MTVRRDVRWLCQNASAWVCISEQEGTALHGGASARLSQNWKYG